MKSCYHNLSYVFGNYRDTFEDNLQPTELHVIQYWMQLYDDETGNDSCMLNQSKDKVIETLAEAIISVWSPFVGLNEKVVCSIKQLLKRTDHVRKNRER